MVRSGDEPTTARSPLGLRLVLAVFGLLSGVAGAAAGVVADVPALTVGAVLLVAVAAVDVVVVRRRMRAGRTSSRDPTSRRTGCRCPPTTAGRAVRGCRRRRGAGSGRT